MMEYRQWIAKISKGVASLQRNGFSGTWEKLKKAIKIRANIPQYTKIALYRQRARQFSVAIKFSILVPLYNTPEQFLREMIHSVQEQTYTNWELCLADGSENPQIDIGRICEEFTEKDPRVRYKKLERNLGISGNTNACIDMATGDYLALFDHDDILHPSALYEMMQVICEKNADFIYTDESTFSQDPHDTFHTHYKPDYAPDTLRAYNYICHFTAFKRDLLDQVGKFRPEYDGSQDYDMILRLTEQAKNIVHIPRVLYYWRAHEASVADSVAAKPYVIDAAKCALSDHLRRIGLKGEVVESSAATTYRIRYQIAGTPLVSILIPNQNHVQELKKGIDSLLKISTYQHWEVVVIENNSTDQETYDYYAQITKDPRIRVVTWQGDYNDSAIRNYGVRYAKGEYVLLLDNDTQVITPDWLEQMLMFAQRQDVGAVGAMLYYPDDTIQHAGVVVGPAGVAGYSHKHYIRGSVGYMNRLTISQNYSCVTGSCMMVRRDVWEEMNGLDESFAVNLNDVDLCMRIRKAGKLVVWTPYAELYHHEAVSRGTDDTPEKRKCFRKESWHFQERWGRELAAGDPYYSSNLTL